MLRIQWRGRNVARKHLILSHFVPGETTQVQTPNLHNLLLNAQATAFGCDRCPYTFLFLLPPSGVVLSVCLSVQVPCAGSCQSPHSHVQLGQRSCHALTFLSFSGRRILWKKWGNNMKTPAGGWQANWHLAKKKKSRWGGKKSLGGWFWFCLWLQIFWVSLSDSTNALADASRPKMPGEAFPPLFALISSSPWTAAALPHPEEQRLLGKVYHSFSSSSKRRWAGKG